MTKTATDIPRYRCKTPTLLQLEAVECGAAALGIILAYHGRQIPLTDLRRECGVSRDGSKASNIVKAACQYGLEAKGFSKSVENVAALRAPCIVFWNFNHFLVVEGFDKDTVYLNDPARGHRSVTIDEFDKAFTGVVLTFKPTSAFKPGGSTQNITQAISTRLRGLMPGLVFSLFAGLLLVIPGLAVPAFIQVFLDSVVIEGHRDWLKPLLGAMFIAILLQAALKYLQLHHLRRLQIVLSLKLASQFMWHLLHLPSSFYDQRYAGEIANRSQLNNGLAGVLAGRLASTVIDVVMIGFYAALMFYYDVILASVAVLFALTNVLVLRFLSAQRVEANMRLLNEDGKAMGTALAGLAAIETIKSAAQEASFFSKWAGYYASAANARQRLAMSNQILSILPALLTALMLAVLIIVGGLRIIDGYLTIGILIAFQSLMTSFMDPVNKLMNLGASFQELRGDLHRVDDVLKADRVDTGPDQPVTSTTTHRLLGRLEIKDLSFGYSPLEKPLIEGFQLSVQPGDRIALVGGSGSGKTTLARLINGDLNPWSGDILIDGFVRDAIPRCVQANSLAAVDQSIALFNGSVRDNLTLWDDTVLTTDLDRACEDAAINDVIDALPNGYDSELLEGGANLSGGQRQRLEIARALVHNPSLVVFDEATSALDAETEALIMQRLRIRGCTCIIVAHRLSTIRDCEQIIVLEQGHIVQRGNHASLIGNPGHYADLINADDGSGLEAQ